ncbi:MAG: hypothetical protein JJ953_13650 [Gracilimonas sp.]|uniref:hypothetical protein n=1 Tax=Gracilimonas TaxID=649462 RepID=UPI001B08EFA8|nr:hypothetical protein [Gracilimonas sp.]MBO6587149.1 hypothetical protein [Gracilimonas sp.]MBO6614363.1 hypothetical protein [Gracilimonas sp.]
MKTLVYIILMGLLAASCASSDKKSTANNQAASDVQPTAAQQDSLVTQPFSAAADTVGLTKITGQLNYTGNEPFTRPALFVSGSEAYVLIGDQTFMSETFNKLNGKRATIYGKMKKSKNAAELEVHYYKLSEQ